MMSQEEQTALLGDAHHMATLLCRLCMRRRPCERPECVGYSYSDQTGADQKKMKRLSGPTK